MPRSSLTFYSSNNTGRRRTQDEKKLNVNQGDTVKVIDPSCKSLDKDLPVVKTYIESKGLVADISENIYSEEDPFYSNTDESRANDLISALLDDIVKIIWCIRGGAGFDRGSIRLILKFSSATTT